MYLARKGSVKSTSKYQQELGVMRGIEGLLMQVVQTQLAQSGHAKNLIQSTFGCRLLTEVKSVNC
jgi:hypothetical protein